MKYRKKRTTTTTKTKKLKKRSTFKRTVSPIERIFAKYLKESGLLYKAQHKILREGRYRGRCFFADFALPEYKIVIECDGAEFHTKPLAVRRDKARQKEIESLGWKVFRFTGSEIVRDARACVQMIINYLEGLEN